MAIDILDFYDDQDASILKEAFETSREPEQFRKIAGQIQPRKKDDIQRLMDGQFGLVIMTKEGSTKRAFPLDSPSEVWLSATYFEKTAAYLPNMAQAIAAVNIANSAQIQNVEINPAITKVAMDFPNINTNVWVEGNDFPVSTPSQNELEKLARRQEGNDPRMWGLTNGGKNRYPLRDDEEVYLAQGYFTKNAAAFSPSERHEFASKILARSIDYGFGEEMAQDGMIAKHAGVGFGTRIQTGMIERIEKCVELGIDSSQYNELSKHAGQSRPSEFAVALETVDRRNGFDQYWDKAFDDPYATTYGNHVKQAGNGSVEIDGVTIQEKQLKTIPKATFVKTFQDTMWESFSKDPVSIFSSIPKPEQRIIANMVKGVNV